MTRLLCAQQGASAADLQIPHGDFETGAELGELADGAQPLFSRAFAGGDAGALRRLTRWGACTALLLGAAFSAAALLLPDAIVSVFSRGDAALTALAVPGLTLYFTNYLFSGVSLLWPAKKEKT